jgi:hypothetical protein
VSGQVRIELYVDPCCPFAWIAYQWLAEVQRHRAVGVRRPAAAGRLSADVRDQASTGGQPGSCIHRARIGPAGITGRRAMDVKMAIARSA